MQKLVTKYHKINRKWILDVVPLKAVGNFLDFCLEALKEQYPVPSEMINVDLGIREGKEVLENGMYFTLPNNFGENLASYTAFAAMVRKGEAIPAVFPADAVNKLVRDIQVKLRGTGLKGWLREFFWFSRHRMW